MAKKKVENKKVSFWSKVKRFFAKIGRGIAGFCVRTYQDLSRMRWASKKTIISATGIVLSFVFLFGAYIIFDDFIIAQIFKLIY